MKIRLLKQPFYIIFSFLWLISCSEKKTQVIDNEQVTKKEKKFEFGFDLDNFSVVKDTLKSGDTFGKLLEKNNIGASQLYQIIEKTKEVLNPTTMKIGKRYAFIYEKKNPEKLHSFVYEPSILEYVVLHLSDSVYGFTEKRKIKIVEKQKAGFIENSLIESALNTGMNFNVAFNLSQIFDYTIDFFHLQTADNFKIIYQERYVDDTIYAGIESVKAAYFQHKGNSFYAFHFVTDSLTKQSGFYDENGNTMKRMFLKAPLDIFRITSKFGVRYHPILHRIKGHFGTDYAAPHGTPIRVTAAGTVVEAGYGSGNGNYVKVKHNATYTTQYLHMSQILVKKGQFVPQGHIIGKVGSTGLATGPHVCYRFWKNGVQVDPLKEKMPEAIPIDEKLKKSYLETIAPLKAQLDALTPTPTKTQVVDSQQVTDTTAL